MTGVSVVCKSAWSGVLFSVYHYCSRRASVSCGMGRTQSSGVEKGGRWAMCVKYGIGKVGVKVTVHTHLRSQLGPLNGMQ